VSCPHGHSADRDAAKPRSTANVASPLERRRTPPHPSRRSLRGLDWFVFCLADVQTGFGPFVAVYLTAQKWTQVDIGLILSISGLVALVGQMPGGALVDAARSERFVAALAIIAISLSALAYAVWPIFGIVIVAAVLQAAASCVLGPAIAAISLGLVGHLAVAERLGRNARFASIGAGLAAAGMGASGYLISSRAVFFVTVALCIPTLFALSRIRDDEIDAERAHGGTAIPHPDEPAATLRDLLRNRPLMVFAGCVALFHLANAAMLPLVASIVTMRSTQWATTLVGACLVVPQLVVAIFSPWVGRRAQQWGRRPLLLLGFAALPLRGMLFAVVTDPYLLVAVQVLDGISAAVLAVMVPLVIADVTRGTGHFNLAQGTVGTGVGIGASLSMVLAGYVSDHFGGAAAFCGLAGLAATGFVLILALLPETMQIGNSPLLQARGARRSFIEPGGGFAR
jgi:predicted MFS family arabinose efflux permease